MLLEVWTNGLEMSDKRVYFINVENVEKFGIDEGWRLFKLCRPEARRYGAAETVGSWEGETVTLLEALKDVDHVFYAGGTDTTEAEDAANLHAYQRFVLRMTDAY